MFYINVYKIIEFAAILNYLQIPAIHITYIHKICRHSIYYLSLYYFYNFLE